MPLRVPRGLLPEDAEARRVVLREYFCDKDAGSSLVDGAWELTLAWPTDASRYVDPDLDLGLGWWGAGVGDVPHAWRREGMTTFSLFDSWCLHSWSRWWARTGQEAARAAGGVVVLHVDDHADLMPPRLLLGGRGLTDAITGNPFDLATPGCVEAAIRSGAVGMGSFMTPFLHEGTPVLVRHLRQRGTAGTFRLSPDRVVDTLLAPGAYRPSATIGTARTGREATANLVVTADPGEWLGDLPEWPALLHIDLDYFSNRFNGDSDWQDVQDRLDPAADTVLEAIRGLFGAIAGNAVRHRIQDVAIAYSPGFFPAELWPRIDGALRRGLASIGAL